MLKYSGLITPKAQARPEKEKLQSRVWIPYWNCGMKFKVQRGNESYVVDLDSKSYAYFKWDVSEIPYAHTVASIFYLKRKPEEFVHSYFHKSIYLKTYSFLINPINGPNLWAATPYNPPLPPKERRQPGKPKMKRVREPDEPINPYKLSRNCLVMKCKNYGKPKHNTRTCKPPVGSNKTTSGRVS